MDVFIISHRTNLDGSIDYYARYLSERGDHVRRLAHPLDVYAGKCSTLHVGDRLTACHKRTEIGIFNLALDAWLTFRHLARYRPRTIVCANNFDTLCALILSAILGMRRRRVIYYASDFSNHRYGSAALNACYRCVEIFCLRRAHLVISNTHRAARRRIALGLAQDRSHVLPNGTIRRSEKPVKKELRRDHFVYVGSVTAEHGLCQMVEAIAPIVSRLVLIGDGPEWEQVAHICSRHGVALESYRNMSHDFVLDFLRNFDGFGLAPYNSSSEWTYYCSPLKVVEYIACGVPVILSSVPEIASRVAADEVGVVYKDLTCSAIRAALARFDLDGFSGRAAVFAEDFDSEKLFSTIAL